MTTVLRLLQDIAKHLNVKVSVAPTEMRELATATDIPGLTTKLEKIEERAATDDRR